MSVQKALTVTQDITGVAGLDIAGDATFSSNVSMAGINNMLSFKTFGSRQIAGGISTTTAVTASEYTDYTASTATNATNIEFIKTNDSGQYVMMYSSDVSGSILISNDYGETFTSKTIAALDNSAHEINKRAAMSLNGDTWY